MTMVPERDDRLAGLEARSGLWVVTGAAGFIGSNLVERLLAYGQRVTGLDLFTTGRRENLEAVRRSVGEEAWGRFTLLEGSVEDAALCARACAGADHVLHHAALVSVPLSMELPEAATRTNVGGFAVLLEAARAAGVRRVVYASSSAVYGDASGAGNREDLLGEPVSPYALTKRINEMQARYYTRVRGLDTVGLRYFNVFGPRQDPEGDYAAIVPRWLRQAGLGLPCRIFGDGGATRDFCFVADIFRANVLAALAPADRVAGEVFNIGCGRATTILELHRALLEAIALERPGLPRPAPVLEPARSGDILHSSADLSRAGERLGFEAGFDLARGLALMLRDAPAPPGGPVPGAPEPA
jgi:UDP-N-acetylglucosamine/UDP-N-acetylgalactosamine 4-epimerase